MGKGCSGFDFMEKPGYELHDVYRALDVLGNECDLIQSEVYKNSHFIGKRNDRILYCGCTNDYFEIEQEELGYDFRKPEDRALYIRKLIDILLERKAGMDDESDDRNV